MKVCPFCGTELPEEAVFCLKCSSVLNERQKITNIDEKPKGKKVFSVLQNINNKKISSIIAVILALVIVLSSCLLAIKSVKTNSPQADDNSEPKTTLVPVTEENGEIVTNDVGEQIYEVTEVVETTTKKSFLEILLDKNKTDKEDEESNKSTNDNEENAGTTGKNEVDDSTNVTSEVRTTVIDTRPTTETTTKKSIWDILAGLDTPSSPDDKTTTKKPASSSTTKPTTSATTTKPSTSATTKPSTTKAPTTEPNQPSATDFEYTEINGEIKITKYTGSSTTVNVPAYINGKHVAFLGENAFTGNSNIKKIIFTGTTSGTGKFYLPKSRTVFYNLPNLTSITFPYETYYRMTDDLKNAGNDTFYDLIINCPKLCEISFADKVNSDYSSSMLRMYSVDGVVFSKINTNTVDSKLLYYPPAKTVSSYTVPSRVSQVEKFAFSDNSYIKSIHFTQSTLYVSANFLGCNNLTKFTVDSGNTKLFAENDVLYTGSATVNGISYKSFYYPPGKTESNFTFTDEYNLSMDEYSFCGNPHIKTVKFCRGVLIYRGLQDGKGRPVALTSILLNDAYVHKIDTNSKAPFTITYYQ